MELFKIINKREIKILVDKIDNIKKEPLIKVRSTLICELLKLRAKEMIKSLGPWNNHKTISKKTSDFFFGQLIQMEDGEIKIPSIYMKIVAEQLLSIEIPYDYKESELLNVYKINGFTKEKLHEAILEIYYDHDTFKRICETNLGTHNYEDELFSPIIVLDDEFKKVYINLLNCYYCYFENENLSNSDKVTRIELNNDIVDPSEYQRIKNGNKLICPSAYLDGSMLCYPIFEEIMSLERFLIEDLISYFNAIEMVKLISSRHEIISAIYNFLPDSKITNRILTIDKIIQEIENKLSKGKEIIANIERKKIQKFNLTLQDEKEELKKFDKKGNTKKPILKGYENNKNRDSWDDVLIYYIKTEDKFLYLANQLKKKLKISPKPKKLLTLILYYKDQVAHDYSHDKSNFNRLNKELRELFNKTHNPIKWNKNQKVFTTHFKIKISENFQDYKTSTLTDEMENQLIDNYNDEVREKYFDDSDME